MALRVTVLGCGGSGGVPLIGDVWGACDRTNPKNRRRRCSILLQRDGTNVLVDTGPDLREQLISTPVQHLDGVVFTHEHADHTHGIDDLRAMNWLMQRPIDCWADRTTLDILLSRFDYCFAEPVHRFQRPELVAHEITGPFGIGAIELVPFRQEHGRLPSLGFRIGRFAYSTDAVHLDEQAFATLDGVDTWIVDCTRETPHPVHAHLELTLQWIERVRPRHAILTHMNHTLDYETLKAKLPPGVEPGYDGMVLEIAD
ncbi:MAG TPA: MBL fold metallo-hydrolase [Azospirillaceae bacterium]|nr:MBL fold metallo-hydrolase [Azospirillaceae bacterium]